MSADMVPGERSPVTRIASAVIWVYVVLCAFVWFGARYVPSDLALIRIATDILYDLVWIPVGVGCWWGLFGVIARRTAKSRGVGFLHGMAAMVAAVAFIALFPQTAFRFLFIPMAVIAVRMVHRILTADTLEEKIATLQERKRGLSDQVMGAAAQGRLSWTREELIELLQPLETGP